MPRVIVFGVTNGRMLNQEVRTGNAGRQNADSDTLYTRCVNNVMVSTTFLSDTMIGQEKIPDVIHQFINGSEMQ